MKRLILPLVIALLAGLGGGSGFSYVRAKKVAAVEKVHADSVKAVEKAKEAKAKAASAVKHDTAAPAPLVPMTPADSIRAEQARRNGALHNATSTLPNAVDPTLANKTAPNTGAAGAHAPDPKGAANASPVKTPGASPTGGKTVVPPSTPIPTASAPGAVPVSPKTTGAAKPASPPVAGNGAAAVVPPGASAATPATTLGAPKLGAPDAADAVLPERRLAKIFGAMQAKDAAKVLEQWSDNDVRTILGMMSDRQAAAILGTFPAARAASITKGAAKTSGASK